MNLLLLLTALLSALAGPRATGSGRGADICAAACVAKDAVVAPPRAAARPVQLLPMLGGLRTRPIPVLAIPRAEPIYAGRRRQ